MAITYEILKIGDEALANAILEFLKNCELSWPHSNRFYYGLADEATSKEKAICYTREDPASRGASMQHWQYNRMLKVVAEAYIAGTQFGK